MSKTIRELLQTGEALLLDVGVPNPKVDAEWLLSHVLHCKRIDLYLNQDKPLSIQNINHSKI